MYFLSIVLIFITLSLLITIRSKKINKSSFNNKKKGFLIRFKNHFSNKSLIRERLSERFSYTLMADPEYNISIGAWYNEIELREKADIHRARLSKYGKSKMNGEMLFLGPKGGVYKYNSDGKKKYL